MILGYTIRGSSVIWLKIKFRIQYPMNVALAHRVPAHRTAEFILLGEILDGPDLREIHPTGRGYLRTDHLLNIY